VLLIFVGLTRVAAQEGDKEYTKTLKKMFKVSGSEENYVVVIHQFIDMFKTSFPEVKKEIWDELEFEFLLSSMDELTVMLAPVYIKYLSKNDLEMVIEFYTSDVGKKLAKMTPLITEESMKVGEEWGKKIGEDLIKRLEEKENKK